jgi:hypothetical protein
MNGIGIIINFKKMFWSITPSLNLWVFKNTFGNKTTYILMFGFLKFNIEIWINKDWNGFFKIVNFYGK